MKIISVNIDNFMTIGHAFVELADRGLCLIQGVNEDDTSTDSNGAGKSSIADAICWALYGKTARDEDGDNVVNRFVGKDCAVVLTVEEGASRWSIARYRKHSKHKNGLTVHSNDTSANWDLTLGTNALTQQVVDGIIGSSHDVFTASIYAGQEKMPDLPAMTDKNLKLLIEEAAGTTVLEAAAKIAKTELTAKQGEAKLVAERLKSYSNGIIAGTGNLTANDVEMIGWETRRNNALVELIGQIKTNAEHAEVLEAEISGKSADLMTIIKVCDDKIKAVDGEKKNEAALQASVERLARKITEHKTTLKHLKGQHEAQKADLDKIDHKVGCPCDACGRPLTVDEIAPAKALRVASMSDVAKQFSECRALAEAAIVEHKSASEALEAFRHTMTDVSHVNAERVRLSAELRSIEAKESQLAGLKRQVEIDRRRHAEKSAEKNPHEATQERIKGQLEALAKQIAEAEEQAAKLEEEVLIAEEACAVFAVSGVRAHILDEVTPFLNDQTAKYLSTLSDGNLKANWTTLVKTAKGELREKFSIEVVNEQGAETFKGISGGEKRKVRVATALALQDLVASRATKPISLFIADEVDDALDPAGVERLMMIFDEKARERGSLFVISHNELKNWCSQSIVVRKKGKMSTVEESVV